MASQTRMQRRLRLETQATSSLESPQLLTSDGIESTITSAATPSHRCYKQSPCQCSTVTDTTSLTNRAFSPRRLTTDLPVAILEEAIDSGSDSPNDIEPLTPSSYNSQDFRDPQSLGDAVYTYIPQYNYSRSVPNSTFAYEPHPPPKEAHQLRARPTDPTEEAAPSSPRDIEADERLLSQQAPRRSTSTLKRKMSSLFRRSNSNVVSSGQPINGNSNGQPTSDNATPRSAPNQGLSKTVTNPTPNSRAPPSKANRSFSFARSATTTRSNTPPSPGSPQDISPGNVPTSAPNGSAQNGSVPQVGDFNTKKKNRSSTGLSLRGKTINFLTPARGGAQPARSRRASSFDSERAHSKTRAANDGAQEQTYHPPERQPWALPPDAGTGAKARRMSLSLPDDFTVDVAELTSEFEYQSKFLGRHGKHLGKGAASKVTLMARKGCPEELYAVKEFRAKSGRESKDDYDKKIKSEFSIAKSLHHPNIIETVRLCTDHSRWNHVMEYCSEGDLFGLVSKGHLKDENKKKDRLCLFKQLIQGVNYLHQNGIAHRDIKLENLLLTKDSKLKITDFGVSEVFCGTHPGLREAGGQCGTNMAEVRLCSPGICGSEPYIAPEVLAKKHDYDPRPLDVWSTAIVMVYLTFGGAIWARAAPGNEHYDSLVRGWDKWYSKHEADANITETDYPHHKAFDLMVTPPALRRVLLQMLNPDPAKRISIADVLNNRWIKNVECCQVESYDDPTQVIDATKKNATWNGHKKVFCHNHLPIKSQGHSLGPMPGQPGY